MANSYTYNADTKTWTDSAGKPVNVTIWDLIKEVNMGGVELPANTQPTTGGGVVIDLSAPKKGWAFYAGWAMVALVTIGVVRRGMAKR